MPVNSEHAEYSKKSAKWQRCRDVVAGQDAVHAAGEKYLPRLKDQTDADYKAYVLRASFTNYTWRTISGLVGMMLRKPPKIEVPKAIEALLDDIDGAGTPFHLFVQDDAENALTTGRLGILVDYPEAPSGATLADARTMNLRPTMQLYRAESIINWRTAKVSNRKAPTLVVLKECDEVLKEDEYVVKEEDRWRVLDLIGGKYRQRLFKKKEQQAASDKAEFEQIGVDVFPKMRNAPMAFIPFYVNGPDDASLDDVDDPPLIDLVDINLSHYRTTADYSHGCHFTGLPTLFLSGFKSEEQADGTPKQVYIGSEAAIVTSNPDADGKYIEFTGQGLTALKEKLDREEQQMAVLGARALEPQKKAPEAADSGSIRRKGEESMLASVAQAISLCVERALKTFVEWAGADPTGVEFALTHDFYPAGMNAQELAARVSAWSQGAPGFSDQSFFDQMQEGEIIDQELTLEDEQVRIAERQQQLMDQQVAAQAAQAELAAQSGSDAP